MPLFKRKTKAAEVSEEAVKAPETEKKEAAKKVTAKKETKKKAAPKAEKKAGAVSPLAAKTLIAPLVTEKTASMADDGVYAFRVPLSANRVAIREAFKELYKVTPTKVNIVRVHGKEHKFGRFMTRRSDWKKALVTVPSGTRVDIFTI